MTTWNDINKTSPKPNELVIVRHVDDMGDVDYDLDVVSSMGDCSVWGGVDGEATHWAYFTKHPDDDRT